MAKSRIDLQYLLENLLGSRHVYFQPPETIKMNYPAIVYSLDGIDNEFADNSIYNRYRVYQIIVIDKSPDSTIAERVSFLPFCRFVRSYCSDNLNHYVFTISF